MATKGLTVGAGTDQGRVATGNDRGIARDEPLPAIACLGIWLSLSAFLWAALFYACRAII